MHNKQTKPVFYAYGNLIASKTDQLCVKIFKTKLWSSIKNIFGFDVDNKFDLKIIKQLLKKISIYEKIRVCISKEIDFKVKTHAKKNSCQSN